MNKREIITKLEEIARNIESVLTTELNKLGYYPDYIGVVLSGSTNNVAVESPNCEEIAEVVKGIVPSDFGVLTDTMFYPGDEDIADTITLIYNADDS